ncbi:MAG: hypothetical protein EOM50_02210 [Erysipelotrichia bacterium]|nr:hypothetical protein [Erysipelotrichia bacterium]NCC55240.1 hypothetical protein [Erysipelotrichia bacterium]
MLETIAVKYYQEGYNCAESIIHAGNEAYDLKLHEADMRMCAAFGGGFQIGDVCGALSGAACVISARYIKTKAHDQNEEIRALTQKLVISFQKRLGSRLCMEIKPVHHNKEVKCQNTVALAAQVLEEVINEWDQTH